MLHNREHGAGFGNGKVFYNNNNFILYMQELDSLPRKVAGKLVVAGQDK